MAATNTLQASDTTPTVTGTSFVTSVNATPSPRHDYDPWVGMQFTVGSQPIWITAVGRYVLTGDTLIITMALYGGANQLTQLFTATVDPTTAAVGNFAYVAITPFALSANTTYALAFLPPSTTSDNWGDITPLTGSGVATFISINADANPPTTWAQSTGSSSFGPVDFKYTLTAPPAYQPGYPVSALIEEPTEGMQQSNVVPQP